MEDDHIPFLKRNVPVLHIIPKPFPNVWHQNTDTAAALDDATMLNWCLLMRVFVTEYLHLSPGLEII